MQKRILYIANDHHLYGANQSLLDLLGVLQDKKDIDLYVVFPKKNEEICRLLDMLNCKYFILNYRSEILGRSNSLRYIFITLLKWVYKLLINQLTVCQLSKIVKRENINIIHSNSSVIAIGEELAKRNKIRHIWHLREYIGEACGIHLFGGPEKYKRRIQNSDQLIAISKGVAADFGVTDKAYILHDAVALRNSPIEDNKHNNYFLVCGTLRPLKGIESAIQAFQQFVSEHKNYKLLIAGTGEPDYELHLKQLVNDLDLDESVEFLGYRNNIQQLMAGATAFLMCSEKEGLGRVSIEAMLNKCPVIGFDNAGTSEIVTDGQTGLLYKTLNQLVEQMNYVVNHTKAMDLITKTACQYAKKTFSSKTYGEKIYRYYEEILAN
ncbi:glycosyltransferase [Draconibacterium halophilum]|uniref:Glycosyltransferase n=1 Tax=Draconibacterium halophilum TaxID=2706887 RepID=A0A6C0RF09_9BACT|nr:glycosyltransferase [Draconibacterium halophilum]QIA08546.1 glycosyltransferase [Draconibacterium halophilum]